jgi:hypothetical protein
VCGEVAAESSFDLGEMLRATIEALGRMDAAELEILRAKAEAIAAKRLQLSAADAKEALTMKQALGELLLSTERSLRVLRGMHDARVRRTEETAWAR